MKIKRKNIFCLDRDRINMTGALNMIILVPIKFNYVNKKFEFDNYMLNAKKYSEE